jgi:hypothetical protein
LRYGSGERFRDLAVENGDIVCEMDTMQTMVKEVVTAEMPAVTVVVAA